MGHATAFLPYVPIHVSLYTLVSQSDQGTHSITEWWDQCHMFTLFCRSSAAPAFTSSETTSVSPLLAANISGDSPSCVMTDMCSETLMTSHTRLSLHVWGDTDKLHVLPHPHHSHQLQLISVKSLPPHLLSQRTAVAHCSIILESNHML